MKKIILFAVIFILLVTPAFASSDGTNSNPFDFIISLFVPSENYFDDKIIELNDHVNYKLGGIGYLYQTMNSFFNTLKSAPNYNFNIKVPDNFIAEGQQGGTYDVFGMAKPFINIGRGAISCFLVITTCMTCYKKLVKLFEK